MIKKQFMHNCVFFLTDHGLPPPLSENAGVDFFFIMLYTCHFFFSLRGRKVNVFYKHTSKYMSLLWGD